IGREIKNSSRRNFTLSGIVIDAETNRPLSGVSIMVRERNMGTTTNEDGYYEINLPAGSYLLETSSMETKELKKRVVIYNDGKLDLALEEGFEQLGEVILATNSNRNVKQAITGV